MKFKMYRREEQTIPDAILRIAEVDGKERIEVNALPKAVVLLKTPMTARELAAAAESLHKLSTDLYTALAEACVPCGCPDDCPCDPKDLAEIPDGLQEMFALSDRCVADLAERWEEVVYGK